MPVQVRPSAPAFACSVSFGGASRVEFRWCRTVAPPTVVRHIAPMVERLCKPGEDLKRLWRTLLPGMPFPACGVPRDSDEIAGDAVESAAPDDTAEPNRKRGAVAR